jgi:hypothetical protein
MDKDSSIVKKLINNEEFVSKAERVAEALEVFEKNKTLQTFSYVQPIVFSALELLREYYSARQATPFPTAFFQHKTENKLKINKMATSKKPEQTDNIEERAVKAFEKIAGSLENIQDWMYELDTKGWSERLEWYLNEFYMIAKAKTIGNTGRPEKGTERPQ